MQEINYKLVGTKIKNKRKELGYSQESLAELCNISPSYLGHIERGSRRLSMDIAVKLAYYLNVSLDYLLLDYAGNSPAILTNIEAVLRNQDSQKVESFLKTVKILSENIDKL